MLTFALEVLATARLTRLITQDEIMEPIRDEIAGRAPSSRLAYLVTCPICVSVWAGAVVAGSALIPGIARPRGAVVRMLALSEATIALRELRELLDG